MQVSCPLTIREKQIIFSGWSHHKLTINFNMSGQYPVLIPRTVLSPDTPFIFYEYVLLCPSSLFLTLVSYIGTSRWSDYDCN